MPSTGIRGPATLLLVSLLATACPGDGEAPVIESFSTSAMSVPAGGTVQLSWSVTGASNVVISGTPGGELIDTTDATGTVTSAAIDTATTFTLVATNDTGSVDQSVMVTVETFSRDPRIDSLTATPMQTQEPGEAVVLAWETSNTTSVDIQDRDTLILGDADPDGMTTVTPEQTRTYTLTAKGDGPAAMRSITVSVPGPAIERFSASRRTVASGNTTDLSWSITNADAVTITDDQDSEVYDGSELNGSITVTPLVANPPGAVTYTLEASDASNRSVTDTVTIMVNAPIGPAINDFAASPASIAAGGSSELSWDVSNAAEIEILAGGRTATTSADLTGSLTVTPTTTTEYTLIATDGDGNTAMAMAAVSVISGPPSIVTFQASPNPVPLGAPTTLSWAATAADSVRILNGNAELYSDTLDAGTFVVTPTIAETTYTLEASNSLGTNEMDVTVYAHAAPVIHAFTATPLSFTGTSTTAVLTWDVSNAATLGLMAGGQPVTGFPALDVTPSTTDDAGTYSVHVTTTTTFTLVVGNAGGQQTQDVTVQKLP